jgi:D-glycero-D-manno-heptose 1,7-bisphosphate phosphatase
MTVLRNGDRWQPSNTSVSDGRVVAYEKGAPPGTHAFIDYGYLLLPTAALIATSETVFDLRAVVDRLMRLGTLAAYEVSERFHDIGTPEALAETDAWLRAGGDAPRWAVFLDRDGVLTEATVADGAAGSPLLASELRVMAGAQEAVAALADLGARVFVVTNQPDVARGTLALRELATMNHFVRDRLRVHDIRACPHDGTDGCACRKPKPGMLDDLAREWHVDLAASWTVGDRWVDIAAGRAAGTRTILVERPYSWAPTAAGSPPAALAADYVVADVTEAAALIARMPGRKNAVP